MDLAQLMAARAQLMPSGDKKPADGPSKRKMPEGDAGEVKKRKQRTVSKKGPQEDKYKRAAKILQALPATGSPPPETEATHEATLEATHEVTHEVVTPATAEVEDSPDTAAAKESNPAIWRPDWTVTAGDTFLGSSLTCLKAVHALTPPRDLEVVRKESVDFCIRETARHAMGIDVWVGESLRRLKLMTDKFVDYVAQTEKDKADLAHAEKDRDLARDALRARDLEVAGLKAKLAHLEGQAEADLRAAKELAAREREEAVKAERERLEREHAELIRINREQAVEEFQKSATYIMRMGDFAEEAYEKAIGDVVGLHPGLPGLNVDALHFYYKGPCPTRYEKKTPVPYTPLLDSIGGESEEGDEEDDEEEVVTKAAASGSGGAVPPPKPTDAKKPATSEGGGSTSPKTAT